ncbi:NERD domain-containing protein [Sporolactobacillus nakayamae]|uniref:Topoisomerase DNA binding C4 zinc finger n=1 Tax=Sporolactobacillus nakayamae TaxID=269670 RepID=A0A1I2PI02_9BACL|nr:NERD domain-containing protein [Sporolactobacillus nakayamae]SFG15792.1 Topoisomerase DNA binding C4 zinc finger [Sporolactobacillus nakayamae]
MTQLYLYYALITLAIVTVIAASFFIIYTYQNIRYKNTQYYRMTHRPYLKTLRSVGSHGEYLTYKQLRPIERQGRFLFNVYLPKDDGKTTELDVLLIHKSGIYVFESKNYSGWIFGTESQRTWTQSLRAGRRSIKNHFYNPIMQNASHMKYLKQCLSDYPHIVYHSLILFSDRCELKKITLDQGSAQVMNRHRVLNHVKRIISQTGAILTADEIEAIYQKLVPYSQVSEEVKQTHIENIQARYPKKKKSLKETSIRNELENSNAASETAATQEVTNPPEQSEDSTSKDTIQSSAILGEETDQIENRVVVDESVTAAPEKICPRCGKPMTRREAKRGKHIGDHFWGCSGFPKCRYIEKEAGEG